MRSQACGGPQRADSEQGAPLVSLGSARLANVYLNELDQAMHAKMAMFNKGKARKTSKEYLRMSGRVERAKKQARQNGNWTAYKALRKQMLSIPSGELQDPEYRRLFYTRYADDFLGATRCRLC